MLGTHRLVYIFYFYSSSVFEGHQFIQQSGIGPQSWCRLARLSGYTVFNGDVDTSTYMQQYRVLGVIFHVGNELKAGHYKAALSGAIRNGRQQAFYITDDDRPVLKLKQASAEMNEGDTS